MNYSGTKIKSAVEQVFKIFLTLFSMVLFIVLVGGVYLFGYYNGVRVGQAATESTYSSYLSSIFDNFVNTYSRETAPEPVIVIQPETPAAQPTNATNLLKDSDWGGPDLWEAVNTRRNELGVNSLNQKDNLCTIASIRLNELLELGKLDGHEGFSNMTERRPDLEHIFSSYSTVAEFLAAGGDSPAETVSLWENSLGHKKLLTGGEYVWGCIYAQNSFAVAIAAF